MKIMTIQVPDDSVELVEEFVERIGGNVEEHKEEKKLMRKNEVKESKEMIDHTFMFGKWKDFDIDARKLREETWRTK